MLGSEPNETKLWSSTIATIPDVAKRNSGISKEDVDTEIPVFG